jgi:hypothetical protein
VFDKFTQYVRQFFRECFFAVEEEGDHERKGKAIDRFEIQVSGFGEKIFKFTESDGGYFDFQAGQGLNIPDCFRHAVVGEVLVKFIGVEFVFVAKC